MKTLEYYLALPYRLEIVPDTYEGGYVATYPELPGCITCANTLEQVVLNALDAKKTWLEAAIADNDPIQEPETIDNYSGQFKLRMPKSLHKQLSEQSKREGISMNQYCLFLLAQNNALRLA